jgi:hypothetical protein
MARWEAVGANRVFSPRSSLLIKFEESEGSMLCQPFRKMSSTLNLLAVPGVRRGTEDVINVPVVQCRTWPATVPRTRRCGRSIRPWTRSKRPNYFHNSLTASRRQSACKESSWSCPQKPIWISIWFQEFKCAAMGTIRSKSTPSSLTHSFRKS